MFTMDTKLEAKHVTSENKFYEENKGDLVTSPNFNDLTVISDASVTNDRNNSMEALHLSDEVRDLKEFECTSEAQSFEINSNFTLTGLNSRNSDVDSDEEHSKYEAVVSGDCREVVLIRERPTSLPLNTGKRRLLKISPDEISSSDSPLSDDDMNKVFITEIDSHDNCQVDHINANEKIPELTLKEERSDSRNWKIYTINGVKKKIDMKVIEPYKRVLSHGGYLTTGSYNAIITFNACYLPHRSRVDYNYVMDNLFLYILFTLNQLVTDDYVLVYLHGGTAKECIPTFTWLKKCYRMVDRKLKKNLKALYVVHPTFWLKTLLLMIKPFISSKFSRKMHFIHSLGELYKIVPIEEASIPDRVKQYDCMK